MGYAQKEGFYKGRETWEEGLYVEGGLREVHGMTISKYIIHMHKTVKEPGGRCRDRVSVLDSLCRPGWPQLPLVPASGVLGSKVCTVMPNCQRTFKRSPEDFTSPGLPDGQDQG